MSEYEYNIHFTGFGIAVTLAVAFFLGLIVGSIL